MTTFESLRIIRSLANGVDPESGEVFAADSPLQRTDVVRALFAACEALAAREKREGRLMNLPKMTGEPWTEDEDRKLLSGFDAGNSLATLAIAHQRTQTGVRARLVKYGRLAA